MSNDTLDILLLVCVVGMLASGAYTMITADLTDGLLLIGLAVAFTVVGMGDRA